MEQETKKKEMKKLPKIKILDEKTIEKKNNNDKN